MKNSLFVAQPRPTAGPHPHHSRALPQNSIAIAYGVTRFELSNTSALKIAASFRSIRAVPLDMVELEQAEAMVASCSAPLPSTPHPGTMDRRLATYSMTSSARARSMGGTSSPIALAVLRFMAKLYLVGCSKGRSPAGEKVLRRA